MTGDALSFNEFASFNLAILVYFLGVRLNKKIAFLRHYNIPEPVSGGLLVALVALIVYLGLGKEIGFSLNSRDYLLYCFFTAIGLNARFSDLVKGGKPLLILLFLTVGYMLVQNVVGTGVAVALGFPTGFGLLGGTISLVGGTAPRSRGARNWSITMASWAPSRSARPPRRSASLPPACSVAPSAIT